MRLSTREFNAMNNPARCFIQRHVEFPIFQHMGLDETGLDILEIGCGSGYGATLLYRLEPKSYVGVDLMHEQIALADGRRLPEAEFMVRDATNLSCFPDQSKDVIVIFGILHHIPEWRKVVQGCARLLREGGKLFVEEPDGVFVQAFDRIFHWGHPDLYPFRLRDLEAYLPSLGFTILGRLRTMGFGWYAAQIGSRMAQN